MGRRVIDTARHGEGGSCCRDALLNSSGFIELPFSFPHLPSPGFALSVRLSCGCSMPCPVCPVYSTHTLCTECSIRFLVKHFCLMLEQFNLVSFPQNRLALPGKHAAPPADESTWLLSFTASSLADQHVQALAWI
eukprot:1158136-Pelagomonas_calceolata.AAC.5